MQHRVRISLVTSSGGRRGSIFPQALPLPVDPEVAWAAELLVCPGRDPGGQDAGSHLSLTLPPARVKAVDVTILHQTALIT